MAVGSTIDSLEITHEPEKLTYQKGEVFNSTGLQVIAHYSNGTQRNVTEYLTWSQEPLTLDDADFAITMPHVLYQNLEGVAGADYPAPFVILTLTIEDDIAYGDINGDGFINMGDVSRILSHIAGSESLTETELQAADVSGDGLVNMMDISLVLEYIKGNIDIFPVETQE